MKHIGVIGIAGAWSSQRLIDAFQARQAQASLIDMEHLVTDLERCTAYCNGLDLGTLSALVLRKIGSVYTPQMLDRLSTLSYIANLGVPTYSDPMAVKSVLDRLSCTVLLRNADIPMPPTIITEDAQRAIEAVRRFGRAVFKPIFTTKARGMMVIDDGPGADDQIRAFQAAGNQTMYIQKMVNLPGRDLGVAFLGGRYMGCYARVGDDDSWNTTTHSGGRYEPHEPSPFIVDLARRAQEPFGLDFTCVDVAETDNGPIVFEVSAFGGFRGLWEGCGINAADLYAEYVLEDLDHAA